MFAMLNSDVKMSLRNAMRGEIMSEFPEMEKNLKKLLQENDSKFSFTIDASTMRNSRSYYGITIHFIDKNFEIQATGFDLVPSEAKHTGKDIAKLFYETVERFGIQEKIIGITVDNASANTTFVKELGKILKEKNIPFDEEDQRYRCLCHVLNLGVQDIFKLIKVNIDDNIPLKIVNDDRVENIADEEVNNPADDYDTDLSDLEEKDDEQISDSLRKLRSLVKKIHYSESLNIDLQLCCKSTKEEYVKVILDVKTRWNSTHDMLSTAFRMQNALKKLCDTHSKLRKYKLSENEWSLLDIIKKSLRYFKYVSKIVSSE